MSDAFDWDEFLGTQITIPSLENILEPIDIPEIPKLAQFVLDKIKENDEDQYNSFLKSIDEQI